LSISPQGIVRRDEVIFKLAIENKIPILMVMSGGYQKTNAPVIADSIKNLFSTFNLLEKFKEDKIKVKDGSQEDLF
jgi:hypothetical protein